MTTVKQRVLPTARRLRPLLSLKREYKARSLLYRGIPVKARASGGSVFHCCTWKTASQWIRLVLTDPRIYRYCGLQVDLLGEDDGRVFRHLHSPLGPERLATPLYGTPAQFDRLRRSDEPYRAFFVMRDPRDLLVSWYFSNRHSHRPNPAIIQRRHLLAEMTVAEGLAHQLHTEFAPIGDTLTAWAARAEADPALRLVRYEDLTGADADDHWAALFDHCQMPIPAPVRRTVLATYAFENLSGGREASQEDIAAKYRKGSAGDWRNHFTPELETGFETVLPGLVERLGYRPW